MITMQRTRNNLGDLEGTKVKAKTRPVMGFAGPVAILLVVLAAAAIYTAGAPSITTNDYSQYDAEIITSGGNLTLTPKGVDALSRTQAADGATQGTGITMSSSGSPAGNTALTKGNWGYKVEVQAITGSTPAASDFMVELKVNGTVVDTLYVKSDAAPATGEKVTLTYDLGTSTLGNVQSFVIQATKL